MPHKYTERGHGGYTRLATAQLRGLAEARASASEVLAYAMLTRYHNDDDHPARCWVSAQLAAEALGTRADTVARALNALTKKSFGDGVTVLEKVSDGHNGRAAVYEDNLYAVAVLGEGRGVARQIRRATSPRKPPSSKADTASYSGGVARQIGPSSKANLPTQNKELIVRKADALPSAKQSIGGATTPEAATQERLDTMGWQPRATAGAAQVRPAAALPSRAEYARISAKLATEGLDAVTDDEREAYRAGWLEYERHQ